ncbi:MAG: HAD family hydrolase [Sulfurovum sp.]
MKKKVIIFDMDGTLVNSAITIANAINFVRKNLGFEPMDSEFILSKVNEHSHNPAKLFYHSEKFEADHEKWFSQYYTQNHATELALYNGIEELLLTLKAKGFKIAVATNAYRVSTIESLTHFGIYELFDAIACCDDVKNCKPNPDMLHKILDELNYKSDEAIFIGDGERDELAGKRANIDYIMVEWGFSDHGDAINTVKELEELLIK